MATHKVSINATTEKELAEAARQIAYRLDPWHVARRAAFWFTLGACTVAAMDYGDVWLCVGQCQGHLNIGAR